MENDGPIIVSLDSSPSSGEEQIQHPPLLKDAAWFLYQWVHKWQFVIYIPFMFVASIVIGMAYSVREVADSAVFRALLFGVSWTHSFLFYIQT